MRTAKKLWHIRAEDVENLADLRLDNKGGGCLGDFTLRAIQGRCGSEDDSHLVSPRSQHAQ